MKHVTIVLGAGRATRFQKKIKYRLEVQGIALINRLADQITRECPETDAIVVSYDDEAVPPPFTAAAPGSCRWTCQTLLGTHRRWGDRTVVLLGDVRYRDTDLTQIYKDTADIRVFTDGQDIFAISFSAEAAPQIQKILAAVVYRTALGEGDGRLWRLCGALGYLPKHPVDAKTHECYRILWKGTRKDLPTQDFDFPEELELFEQGRTKNYAYNHKRRVIRRRK